jgi:sec-independent protein translocase protein TatB
MFDIGFSEILLIAVMGLMVLGPERLPGAVRNTSLWVGRLRRSFNTLRTEIEREVGIDDIQHQLRNEVIPDSMKETREQVRQQFLDIQNSISGLDKAPISNLDSGGDTYSSNETEEPQKLHPPQ